MSPEQIFSLTNSLALLGWVLLVFAGRLRWAASLVVGAILPLLLALVYTGLLVAHWGEGGGSFRTLAGVSTLFQNHWLLLAGWVHYLAFDLFIGAWEVRDSQALGISYWIVTPCLALTFLFGPAGLLLYFLVRIARRPGTGLTVAA
jgi:hypothetical protein